MPSKGLGWSPQPEGGKATKPRLSHSAVAALSKDKTADSQCESPRGLCGPAGSQELPWRRGPSENSEWEWSLRLWHRKTGSAHVKAIKSPLSHLLTFVSDVFLPTLSPSFNSWANTVLHPLAHLASCAQQVSCQVSHVGSPCPLVLSH